MQVGAIAEKKHPRSADEGSGKVACFPYWARAIGQGPYFKGTLLL